MTNSLLDPPTNITCPAWCTASAASHADDDPGRPIHVGMIAGGFAITQIADEAPTAYVDRDDDLTAAGLRQLAVDALAAAEWIEANQ